MIFSRSVFRELTVTTLGVGFALAALLTTMQIARLLGNPATGTLPLADVATLLGFNLARYFPIMLVLTLFIATLTVVVRSYRDHEMQVWLASGLGLSSWYKPILAFVVPITLGVAVYTLFLLPRVEAGRHAFQTELKQRDDLSLVTPGIFIEPSNGKQIFFIERLSPDLKQAENVFVHSRSERRDTVIQAANAVQAGGESDQRQIQLNHGIRYEYQAGSETRRMMRFDSLKLWLPESPPTAQENNWRSMETSALLTHSSREAQSELAWRLGWPLSGLIVCLLAVPLANHHPRGGRSYSMVAAVLIFLLYHNGIGIMEKQIERGHIDLLPALLLTHIPALIAAATMLAWRSGWRPLRKPACKR